MNKFVSLCNREEAVECDETTTYKDFLRSIGEKFKIRANSFCIKGVDENNFEEIILLKDTFEIERSEYDNALERLNGKKDFVLIETLQETEDFLTVYGFKKDYEDKTPLYWAAFKSRTEMVKLILEKDFDNAHKEDKNGFTPLYWAVNNGNTEMTKLLLEKDFDNAHKAGIDGETPLLRASRKGRKEIVELLLKKDFDNAHKSCRHCRTPLYWAASKGHTEIVELLLEKDFDNAHRINNLGRTALSSAVIHGHVGIAKLIKEDIEKRKKQATF